MDPNTIAIVAGLIFGPFAGIRLGMNGTRDSVRRIEADTKAGLKRIEGKVDDLVDELPTVRERVSLLELRIGAEERRL